jgi:hypothetical protein
VRWPLETIRSIRYLRRFHKRLEVFDIGGVGEFGEQVAGR